ncbi:hypothetical protein [Streptomyces syringium]|uniref:hypothetical protein n=1 Tax=Streptomyces syringium TaxID=76729 RepID=UPI003AAEC5C3
MTTKNTMPAAAGPLLEQQTEGTEADILRAELSRHGYPAYDGGEGGFTWLVVPIDPSIPEEDVYLTPHFRISSGEHAHRPVPEHDEPWGASLYDGHGEYVETLKAAPEGTAVHEDSAHCARTIAAYIVGHGRDLVARVDTGILVVRDIHSSTYDVLKGAHHLGVIFDETLAGLARGGWAAWSPKASRSDGTVGFFTTKEGAATAIARTWGLCLIEETGKPGKAAQPE